MEGLIFRILRYLYKRDGNTLKRTCSMKEKTQTNKQSFSCCYGHFIDQKINKFKFFLFFFLSNYGLFNHSRDNFAP